MAKPSGWGEDGKRCARQYPPHPYPCGERKCPPDPFSTPQPQKGEGKSARQNANNPRERRRGYTAPVTPPIFTLKARAEQMRRDGVPVHEVARAVGRSPSTIYGWAAQGGWRVEDLEAEGFRESPAVPAPPGAAFPLPLMGRVGDPSGSAGECRSGRRRADPARRGGGAAGRPDIAHGISAGPGGRCGRPGDAGGGRGRDQGRTGGALPPGDPALS